MDNLYYETNNLILSTQGLFQQSERTLHQEIEVQIQAQIEKIIANCEKLDNYVYKLAPNQRQTAKLRIDQLKYDTKHLQSALRVVQNKRQQKLNEQHERELLLSSKFTRNDNTTIDIDYSLQHNTSLQNVNRGVDEMLNRGYHVLESLRDQKGTLKGARRRLLDAANTLGLSNHTMKLIEKRVTEDKYILYGGMFVTTSIVFLLIYYFVIV